MKTIYKLGIGLVAVISLAVLASAVFAQTATTPAAPEAVIIPWGSYVYDIATTLAALTVPFIGWLFRKLPAQWASMLVSARVDQLLERSIDYGLNSVATASRDHKLTVPVANEVLRQAAQYAVDNAPNLVKMAGGTDLLLKKIIARLEVEANAGVAAGTPTVSTAPAASVQFVSVSG